MIHRKHLSQITRESQKMERHDMINTRIRAAGEVCTVDALS